MTTELARAAFQRFVAALNRARDPAALHAAVTDDAVVERCAPGTRAAPGAVLQTFAGLGAVAPWVELTPAAVTFALAGEPHPDGDRWQIEYALSAGEFHNGGIWRARLAADGRIAELRHQPFALDGAEPHGHADHAHETR
ncbi:MAG TPA: hypothetical protein VGC42_15800 [Kofleriaceae bacterium]